MREITKSISVPVEGKPKDFRLTKLDAFFGVSLLRLLARLPEQGDGPHCSTEVEPEDCPRRS